MTELTVSSRKIESETYELRLNEGLDYALITLTPTGLMTCCTSFGDYAYKWNAFGDDFKRFLCQTSTSYLKGKLLTRDTFCFETYLATCQSVILSDRRNDDLNKEDARRLWTYFTTEIEASDSFDYITYQLRDAHVFDEVGIEIFDSEYYPNQTESVTGLYFVETILPAFFEVLKQEIESRPQA